MKNIVFVMLSLLSSLLIFGALLWQWQDCGVVTGQERTVLDTSGNKNRIPQIYAVSRRVRQNEKIEVTSLARASDVDGSALSQELWCYDEKGERISGFLDTSCPGKYTLKWKVKSVLTGYRAEKVILVLVDGRVCS